ncbi:hypothetical protein A1O3_06632 [Capronia epimyces CBS 606.96]|uniref:Uncharacterized protein n=1 Tax=Capronia epimyces CBS 606.96 TaxID=1182542 RepID=W9XQJ6_9EURO|nr:uncharacterized protein A1O3_06632 [Capronia epimyces CBS 606.96]EXJ82817.1 hypothetical protein A1O3_06632 [Capronia epimyces CBS 606.96]
MSYWRIAGVVLTVAACCLAADQDILTILRQQRGIASFIGFLEQYDDLVDILNQGTFSGTQPCHGRVHNDH